MNPARADASKPSTRHVICCPGRALPASEQLNHIASQLRHNSKEKVDGKSMRFVKKFAQHHPTLLAYLSIIH
jgi:hypothetical protein